MGTQVRNTPPRSYFVDESGDGVLFGRRGKQLLGKPGSLRFFMLGLLDVRNPAALQADLDRLRADLLAETYFHGVPSLSKTALAFHAKNDLPEIRREVFRTLLAHDLKFSAVVKDMHAVADYVRNRNLRDPEYRYHPDELYDLTVRRLFKTRLHKEDNYRVFFAIRGKANRTRILTEALETVRDTFCRQKGVPVNSVIHVRAARPHEYAGLQAVDYFLWALQRFYNMREERFLRTVWGKISVVEDVDDIRNRPSGEYYTARNPLNLNVFAKKSGTSD